MSDELDEFDRKAFFEEASGPENWLKMAIALQHASSRVDWTEKHDLSDWRYIPIYRMLLAFAIENLLKGILIAQGHEVLVDGKLNRFLSNHDLRGYADEVTKATATDGVAAVTFSEAEKDLLDELQSYLLWAGRYPIPIIPNSAVRISHSKDQHDAELAITVKLRVYLFRRTGANLITEPPVHGNSGE